METSENKNKCYFPKWISTELNWTELKGTNERVFVRTKRYEMTVYLFIRSLCKKHIVFTTTHNDHRHRRRTTITFLLQHNIMGGQASEWTREIRKKISLFWRWMSQIRTATNVLYVYMCMYKISIDFGFFVEYYHCCCRLVHSCFSVLEAIQTSTYASNEGKRERAKADTVAALSFHSCQGLSLIAFS